MAIVTTIVHKRKMSLNLKVRPFWISKVLKSKNDTFLDKYPFRQLRMRSKGILFALMCLLGRALYYCYCLSIGHYSNEIQVHYNIAHQ